MSDAMLDAALTWLARGVAVLPLQPGSKSFIRGFGPSEGMAKITDEQAAYFWLGRRNCNFAVVTGETPAGNLICLDFDDMDLFSRSRSIHAALGRTYQEATPRGRHIFLYGESKTGSTLDCEIKSRGACVMSAPSRHPSGFVYHPVDTTARIEQAPPSFPLLSEYPQQKALPVAPMVIGGDDLISRIKEFYPIVAMVGRRVNKLHSNNGRWYHGRCCFHDDTIPSLWVDAERGTWGCFACGLHGDVANWVAISDGISIQEAIKRLASGLPR